MAEFTTEVFQNEFLPEGGTDAQAIVRISCLGAGSAGRTGSGAAGEIIMVDTSGSMGAAKMGAAKAAATAAVDAILDGTWFAVVAGSHKAYLAYPRVQSGPGMVQMNSRARAEAKQAIRSFVADGGTAMGTWLTLTRTLFDSVPGIAKRHAIMLTDGENHNEKPAQLLASLRACVGRFQCDCVGIGIDWKVAEVRVIAQALLGSVSAIPRPQDMPLLFAELMNQSMGRGIAQAELRVWVPQGARLITLQQVSPTVEDLTTRGRPVNALTQGFPTGAWGDEEREYNVLVRLPARAIGQEQLAARVQLVVNDAVQTQGLVKARWSADKSLTAQINPEVAHYTGQVELASAIQEGLAAKAQGDVATATTKLGRAIQLAENTGNIEATARLRKVVEVEDARTGTVRLKESASKADEMELDTASTKTTRIKA